MLPLELYDSIFCYLNSKARQEIMEINKLFKTIHRQYFMRFIAKRLFKDLYLSWLHPIKLFDIENSKFSYEVTQIRRVFFNYNETAIVEDTLDTLIKDFYANTYIILELTYIDNKACFPSFLHTETFDYCMILGKNIKSIHMFINNELFYRNYYFDCDIVKFKPSECLPLVPFLMYSIIHIEIEAAQVDKIYGKFYHDKNPNNTITNHIVFLKNVLYYKGELKYNFICATGSGVYQNNIPAKVFKSNMDYHIERINLLKFQ